MVCGEYHSRRCKFLTSEANEWTDFSSMINSRSGPAHVQMSDTEWWITGMNSGNDFETELYTSGVGFRSYVDLPDLRFRHHLIKINATHFMLLGGECFGEDYQCPPSYMFEKNSRQWRLLPDSGVDLEFIQAGFVENSNGKKSVVAAGYPPFRNRSRIFDLETES